MLTELDWILLSRNGYELFATLKYLTEKPDLPGRSEALGPPHSATANLCRRCWTYADLNRSKSKPYCPICRWIITYANRYGVLVKDSIAVWGSVDSMPRDLLHQTGMYLASSMGAYVFDDQRFLLLMPQRKLKHWIEQILIYHPTMTGHILIFPARANRYINTGDSIARILYNTPDYPTDRLWVKFYSHSFQIFLSDHAKKATLQAYDIATFKGFLETAVVLRSLLLPQAQDALYDWLCLKKPNEERFYWGRFLNQLKPEAIDMLGSWHIQNWPKSYLTMIYHLMKYVEYRSTDSHDSLSAGSANQ